jgi:hypothetical protein
MSRDVAEANSQSLPRRNANAAVGGNGMRTHGNGCRHARLTSFFVFAFFGNRSSL